MRLHRLDLMRYGFFTDATCEFPSAETDFHIVFGPNEAGKSTALSAIEDLLFGIPMHSPHNFLHDYSSMRIGAVLEKDGERFDFVRRKGRKDTILDRDDLALQGGEQRLAASLAGADRPFFERMFSLDGDRLKTGGREILEGRDEVGQMLFSAGAGISGLRNRLEKLNEEAEELWGPRAAQRRAYTQAQNKLEEATNALREYTLTARRWEELKKEYEQAEARHRDVRDRFEQHSAEMRRLSRIRRVFSGVRRKTELDGRIQALADVVLLPENARELFEDARRRETQATAGIETLVGQLEQLRAEIGELQPDENLLRRSEDIKQLAERRIRARRAREEMPGLEAERDATQTDLKAMAADLGWPEREIDKLTARIPPKGRVSTGRILLTRRGELAQNLAGSEKALAEAKAAAANLRQRLEAAGEPVDTSGLEAVVKTVREAGDIEGRRLAAESELEEEKARVNRALAALHPAVDTEDALLAIKPPARQEVQDYRDRLRDGEQRRRDLAESIETGSRKLQQAESELERQQETKQVVPAEDLNASRERRDSIWELVRLKHVEGKPIPDDKRQACPEAADDPPAAFEPAMREADRLADQRFEHAEAAGQLAQMARDVESQRDELKALEQRLTKADEEGEQLRSAWQALWAQAPFEPLRPDAMLDWLTARKETLDAIERRGEAGTQARTQLETEQAHRERLLGALAGLGEDRGSLESEALAVLLERAEALLRRHEEDTRMRERLQEDLRETEKQLERHGQTLEQAKKAWTDWEEKWRAALTELNLPRDLDPAAVEPQIDILEQMREKAEDLTRLESRQIEGIRRELAGFEAEAEALLRELAEDLADQDPDAAALELNERLAGAQRVQDQRAQRQERAEDLARRLAASEEERRAARESVAHLMQAAVVSEPAELENAIAQSDSLRDLKQEREEVVAELEQQGDGLAITDLEAECVDADLDEAAAREETLQAELKELEQERDDSTAALTEARATFENVGGDDAAARAEADRQEALAEMLDAAERYAKVRTAALLLHWAIDRYRREKQAPLLKRAGELFAAITGGSFARLRVDYDEHDQAHLAGERPSGETVRVSGMSTGSADQLYLALRVAAVEDYLDRAEPLPFVADDLFISFDDDRAKAGLEVLFDLAHRTQVLFFTHHRHLVEIASEAPIRPTSVVSLADADG